MQNLQISITDVLDDIYATTALGTLIPGTNIALLHPDHADALRLVVRDALTAVLASAPYGAITLKGIGNDAYTLGIRDNLDPAMCTEILRSALCSCTLGIIYGAAGPPAPAPPSLDSLAATPEMHTVRPFI